MMTCTYAMMSDCGTRGTITDICQDTGRRANRKIFPERKRKKKWTGWKPKTGEQKKLNLRKKVMEGDEDKIEEDSAVIQKNY